MVLDNVGANRKLQIAGFSAILIVTVLNYLKFMPVKFGLSLIGIVACVYTAKKLRSRFGIPMVFIRDEANYWGGAFGGLIGGISGYYGATRINHISPVEFGMELSVITIYISLIFMLFTGALLKDIEDGYFEI